MQHRYLRRKKACFLTFRLLPIFLFPLDSDPQLVNTYDSFVSTALNAGVTYFIGRENAYGVAELSLLITKTIDGCDDPPEAVVGTVNPGEVEIASPSRFCNWINNIAYTVFIDLKFDVIIFFLFFVFCFVC